MLDSSASRVVPDTGVIHHLAVHSLAAFLATVTSIPMRVTSLQADASVSTTQQVPVVRNVHLVSMVTLWLAHLMIANNVLVQTKVAVSSCLVETLLVSTVRKDIQDNAVTSA